MIQKKKSCSHKNPNDISDMLTGENAILAYVPKAVGRIKKQIKSYEVEQCNKELNSSLSYICQVN
jgi:hypothetical protein